MAYASSFSMDHHSLPLALLILLWGVVLASSLPAAFDWRDKNVVTPVKDQIECDNSWAFAAVSVVESALLIKNFWTGGGVASLDLSEQQVLDCSKGGGSLGCINGSPSYREYQQYPYTALSYIETRGGLFREQQYPYTAVSTGVCSQPLGKLVSTLGLKPFREYRLNEIELAKALVAKGPAAVTMCLPLDMLAYTGEGVFDNPACCSPLFNETIITSMTLVGYGHYYDGRRFWILKNSWGRHWGDDGYLKLARGINMCDIAAYPSYFIPRD